MSEINVVYQFNEKYVVYAGVSMTSLLTNNDNVNIYVLGEALTENSICILKNLAQSYGANIFFPDTTELLERFKKLGMIPYRGAYSVYLRLFFTEIPEIELAGKRVVYLDADTIIDGSLNSLVDYNLGDKSIGMVIESIRDNYKLMIGMRDDADYFNSGVILYDVDKWVDNQYCDKLVNHIREVRSSYIGDQDFLNLVCEGDVCKLPLIYNFQPLHGRYTTKQYFNCYGSEGYYEKKDIDDATENAVIYHCYRWLGEFPWNNGNLHPFTGIFDKYMALSPWKDYVKEKANKSIALRIEKSLYRLLPRVVFMRVFKVMHEHMLRIAENDAKHQRANSKS